MTTKKRYDLRNPLYLWIKVHKSILNVNYTSTLHPLHITNKDVFLTVLERYLRLYKTPSYRVDAVLHKLRERYNPTHQFLTQISYSFIPCIGYASIKNGIVTSPKNHISANYAREKFTIKATKRFKTQDELDLHHFSLELKGIKL